MLHWSSCWRNHGSCGFEEREVNGEKVFHLPLVDSRLDAARFVLQDFLAKGTCFIPVTEVAKYCITHLEKQLSRNVQQDLIFRN